MLKVITVLCLILTVSLRSVIADVTIKKKDLSLDNGIGTFYSVVESDKAIYSYYVQAFKIENEKVINLMKKNISELVIRKKIVLSEYFITKKNAVDNSLIYSIGDWNIEYSAVKSFNSEVHRVDDINMRKWYCKVSNKIDSDFIPKIVIRNIFSDCEHLFIISEK